MNQQTLQEEFLNYCKNTDISEAEINDPNVFYSAEPVKALIAEMNQDKKFAEETLANMAAEFKTMPPYRSCLCAFIIGLFGERGVTSLNADRDLLDFYHAAVTFVMNFIVRMGKASHVPQLTPELVVSFFKDLDIEKTTKNFPELIELIKGMPQVSTAVLSRIATSRAMRSYLRNTGIFASCATVGIAIPTVKFVASMLTITEQEQLLVLFPSSKIGFEVTVEEISSNFELFSLLQVALSKEGHMPKLGLPDYQYDEIIADLLDRRMKFPPMDKHVMDVAAFNYYNLHPIVRESRGRYRMDTDYLCNGAEKINAIGSLDGRKILLADKATVPVRWADAAVYGMHPNLHPKLTINRILPKEEYDKWVEMVEGIGAFESDFKKHDEENFRL